MILGCNYTMNDDKSISMQYESYGWCDKEMIFHAIYKCWMNEIELC